MDIASSIFGFLHTQTRRTFGIGSYLFLPTVRGSTDYTVIIPCTAGTNQGRSRELTGLLTIGTDTRTFTVAADLLPFIPESEDILLFGTPLEASPIAAELDPETATFTAASHGLVDGDAVRLSGDDIPPGLESAAVYYLTGVTANTFQISATPGGTALEPATAGDALTFSRLLPDPDNPPVKFRLTGADHATFHRHYRLTAQLHG